MEGLCVVDLKKFLNLVKTCWLANFSGKRWKKCNFTLQIVFGQKVDNIAYNLGKNDFYVEKLQFLAACYATNFRDTYNFFFVIKRSNPSQTPHDISAFALIFNTKSKLSKEKWQNFKYCITWLKRKVNEKNYNTVNQFLCQLREYESQYSSP